MKLRPRVPEFFHHSGNQISSVFSTNWTRITRIVLRGLLWVFILALATCIPIGVLVHVMRRGHKTQFPPSDSHTGFHPNPDTRGTINIITMCLLTIFSCVYVAVHPSINTVEFLSSQTRLVLLTLFAPESLFGFALNEFFIARRGRLWMRSRGFSQWTMTHAFAVEMGCFTVENGEDTLVLSGSNAFYDWVRCNVNPATHTLDCGSILTELNDRSKHSLLAKAFVVLQALKVAVQVIARAA